MYVKLSPGMKFANIRFINPVNISTSLPGRSKKK